MEIYTLNLTLLLTLCLTLFLLQYKRQPHPPPTTTTPQPNKKKSHTPFLLSYTLSTAADWLQGPHLHPLYSTTYALPAPTIALLFAAGFGAAALSGLAVGAWADARGRKRACLVFCAVYAGSCGLTAGAAAAAVGGGMGMGMVGLVVGRVLGGVGTGLLFVGFESWVVGDLRRQGREAELGWVMGAMSGLNSAAAIVSGVASEWVVVRAGSRKAPFMLAVGVLVVAAGVIGWFWVSCFFVCFDPLRVVVVVVDTTVVMMMDGG